MKETKEHPQQVKNQTGTKYACPEHCEEDKVYDKPGKCPICGQDLKKI